MTTNGVRSLSGDVMVIIEWSILQARCSAWVTSDSKTTVTDALGMTATMMYDEDVLTGWIDPRGIETRIQSTPDGMRVDQAGLRTWNLSHTDGVLTELELTGSGIWKWQYDTQGRLTQITDPSLNKLTLLRENDRSIRVLRHNGFVDLSYSAAGYLTEVSDISGRLVSIERDVYGHIVRLQDAVGETFVLERDGAGLLRKLILRDGREWVIERDSDGHIRNLVLPNQEVWGFTRDSWGTVTALDRSHDENFSFVLNNGVWSVVSLPNGERWTVRRDGYNRIVEVVTSSGSVRVDRDVLGQVVGITVPRPEQHVNRRPLHTEPDLLNQALLEMESQTEMESFEEEPIPSKTWFIERDVFGNIDRWGNIDLEIGAWDTIQSHTQGEQMWRWHRDSSGRLIAIESGEDRIDIGYDGSGEPIRWSQGDSVSTIKRNHWGWVTNIDEQWLQRDPRGLIEKSGIYDLTWRWNRNASGAHWLSKVPIRCKWDLR